MQRSGIEVAWRHPLRQQARRNKLACGVLHDISCIRRFRRTEMQRSKIEVAWRHPLRQQANLKIQSAL